MKLDKMLNIYRPAATLLILLMLFLFSMGCQDQQQANPKPRAYPKITFPEKKYTNYQRDICPFSFEYPAYSKIVKKETADTEPTEHPCWFDLVIPEFNGRIHCSYYEINDDNKLDSLIYDSFALVGKHNIKAQYIEEIPLKLSGKGGGMLFRIKGPVASPTQFFVTDSTSNFLRGSLYFYNQVQLDSMKIVYDFVDEDIDHLLETFSWR
jgi:gliding motility-associated lipoprotein GldD